MDHGAMIEEACHLAYTRKQYMSPKLGFVSLYHLLAEGRPRICMDGEDDKNLERMEPSKRSFAGISRNKEGR
jgi:hypothetical protein